MSRASASGMASASAHRYTSPETLHRDDRTALYRACREDDRRSVVIKVVDPRRCRPGDLERLRHEYDVGASLDLSAIVRPLGLETYQGMPALVLEDPGGQPLDRLLGSPMPVERFLELAARIAGAAAELHGQGVIHKDIKPGNVLVHPATLEVKLTDLGVATRLPREQQPARPPQLIEGTLPYMSPEQTGRMNRAVDSRTDLYSLGVTFYQMLTGRLPFEARDPLEWIHCHVARVPPSPPELVPEVPEAVKRIVMKLLAKMADDRYQTARGLERDLARCLEQWRSRGRIEPFTLGEWDIPDRLQIPQRLYGREEQVAVLRRAFERVAETGSPELVLVSGYSGIGKSSLVHELQKPIVGRRGAFVAGKFDRYRRDVPYSALFQALRELVLDVLAQGEERVAAWGRELRAALGVNGQVLVDVIPEVELVIGTQAAVSELPPAEAQSRFQLAVRCFVEVFARESHPLTLFLDDLQWADPASLAILQELVTRHGERFLLVVGAYRDNEVTPAHPLAGALEAARGAGARVSDVVLGPLAAEDLTAFVGDALHCPPRQVAPLSDLVREKTAANPFFAIQFLTAVYEQGLLHLDERSGAWSWDVAEIRARGATDNVVELLVGKLKRLPPPTQEALQQVACMGNSAEIGALAMVLGRPEEEAGEILWPALRDGLLLRLGSDYEFVHDRVQEAAYSLVPEESRPAAHLRIGRLMLSHLSEGGSAERVFEVVNHLNRGIDLITGAAEREELCRLDVLAGKRAKASAAYTSARSFLAVAASLLPPDAWGARYAEAFELHLALSECEYLAGDFRRADELVEALLGRAGSDLDRARVLLLRMVLYQGTGRFEEAWRTGLRGLGLFGVSFPDTEREIAAAFQAERQKIAVALAGRGIADLADAPELASPELRLVLRLLMEAAVPAYNVRPDCHPLLLARAVGLSVLHGNTQDSIPAYCAYVLVLVPLGDIAGAIEFTEAARRLAEKLGDLRASATVVATLGSEVNHWQNPIPTDVPLMDEGVRRQREMGDLARAGIMAIIAAWTVVVETGEPLDGVLKSSEKYLAFAEESRNDIVRDTIRLIRQLVAALKGTTRAPASLDDDTFSETACLAAFHQAGFGAGIALDRILKQVVAFFYGRYGEAHGAAVEVASAPGPASAFLYDLTHHFFRALSAAALYPRAPPSQQQELARILDEELQRHKLWAGSHPGNFLHRHALLSAEVARVEGRELDAERLYEEAIRSARENGFVQNEALAWELASRFHRARGFDFLADTYLREARACYLRWGADGKVKQLEEVHPQVLGQQLEQRLGQRPLAPAATFSARTEQLDLLSVVKASQAISAEVEIEKLVGTLLQVALEQGAARRGYLVLAHDGALSVEAEASLEEKGVATRILPSQAVESSLPVSIIQYARLTRKPVIIDDAAAGAGKFASDAYFTHRGTRSVLCLPIVRHDLVGLLYLENDLVAGAFTPDRLTALSLLASQAAISMENARLLRETQRAVRMRDEFLLVASHELRTPMTSLAISLKTLQRAERSGRSANAAEVSKSVELASRQGTRLNHLISDILDISRIETRSLKLKLAHHVELGDIVRDVVRRFEADLAAARCALSIRCEDPIVGRWDPSRVGQVVTNLLSNAVKFGAGNPVEIHLGEEAGLARLSVHDHGIGIDPSHQARIFDRFERAVSVRYYGGLGLGLYISRWIVEAHGGSLRVESQPGAGSTFTVELPCAGPPGTAPSREEEAAAEQAKPARTAAAAHRLDRREHI